MGNIKKNCRYSPTEVDDKRKHRDSKQKANAAGVKDTECSSDSENIGLVVQHAMPSLSEKAAWIIYTLWLQVICVMINLSLWNMSLKTPLKVTLGDGYEVDAIGCGVVMLNSVLPSGESKRCYLQNVLCVPRLSYNLFSVSVTTEHGKTVGFSKDS